MITVCKDVEAVEVSTWRANLDTWFGTIADDFFRVEARRHAKECMIGLLAPVERKNCWQLSEAVGHRTPDMVQYFLMRSSWDPDVVCERLAHEVSSVLGGADSILVIDDTGFIKQGKHSVGVQRQYTGTSGKVDNCQLGVFAALVSPRGRALIDRQLYLPASWINDPKRCVVVGVPAQRQQQGLLTKGQLARSMVETAIERRCHFGWVTAYCAYGGDGAVRQLLEDNRIPYVVEVQKKQTVIDAFERRRQISTLIAEVPAHAWQPLSQGAGERGPREYDWLWGIIPTQNNQSRGYIRSILARRSLTDPDDIAYFLCCGPPHAKKETLIAVAGTRWGVETSFEEAKGQCGMDAYQVRTWISWYRHITMAMFAYAFLQITAATDPKEVADWIVSQRLSSGICWE